MPDTVSAQGDLLGGGSPIQGDPGLFSGALSQQLLYPFLRLYFQDECPVRGQ